MGRVLKEIFQTPYFRVVIVSDEESVELCGALKVCRAAVQYTHLIISLIMQLAAKSQKNAEFKSTKKTFNECNLKNTVKIYEKQSCNSI